MTTKNQLRCLGLHPWMIPSLVDEHVQGSPNNDQRDEVCFIVIILVLLLLVINAKLVLAIDE